MGASPAEATLSMIETLAGIYAREAIEKDASRNERKRARHLFIIAVTQAMERLPNVNKDALIEARLKREGF